MIVEHCQRWTLGRAHRRPAGEVIRPRADDYEVAPVAAAAARAFVELHHYSGSASPPAHPFGLWRRGELVGVALFGPPASMNAHRAVFPSLAVGEAVTLGRLVLLDEVPGNGESWFVARCLRELAARGVVGVESCADPIARADAAGRRVFPGHAGTVYQALSGRYVGRTNAATKYLLPDGRELSNRADGWYLRADVIWHKPSPLPEPVSDRPTKAHEYIFLLSKSERYYCDADAVREPLRPKTLTTFNTERRSKGNDPSGNVKADNWSRDVRLRRAKVGKDGQPVGSNKRSVWTVASQPYDGAHFATFPPKLIVPCVLAGAPPGGVILDPFFGSGTTGEVAEMHGRRWIGFDLNPEYAELAKERTAQRSLALRKAP